MFLPLRTLFPHRKVFCHRFFMSHGAACPVLCAEVEGHRRCKVYVEPEDAPKQLIWKPRYVFERCIDYTIQCQC